MYTVKVLKRKDASSVAVAVVLALVFNSFLARITAHPAESLLRMSDNDPFSSYTQQSGFRELYLYPLVMFLLQLILIEIAIALIVWLRPMLVSKKK